MYFESRSHEILPVADAAAAVRAVSDHTARTFHCPTWRNARGERIALVDDGSIDDAWGEVAVVNLDTKRQLESITFGWCDNEAQKLECVQSCELDPGLSDRDCIVPMGDNDADQDVLANFTCSCCGEGFESTLREQLPHDQDAGYGHCPACFPPSVSGSQVSASQVS